LLLLEHGDKCKHRSPPEAHATRLERAVQVKRELAVTLRDSGTGSRRRREVAHDVTRNGDSLAVEVYLDDLLRALRIAAHSLRGTYFRGLNA
jgi:hypothetical protein